LRASDLRFRLAHRRRSSIQLHIEAISAQRLHRHRNSPYTPYDAVREEQSQQPGLIAVLLAKASLQLGTGDEQLIVSRYLGGDLSIIRLLGASALGSRARAHLEGFAMQVRDASVKKLALPPSKYLIFALLRTSCSPLMLFLWWFLQFASILSSLAFGLLLLQKGDFTEPICTASVQLQIGGASDDQFYRDASIATVVFAGVHLIWQVLLFFKKKLIKCYWKSLSCGSKLRLVWLKGVMAKKGTVTCVHRLSLLEELPQIILLALICFKQGVPAANSSGCQEGSDAIIIVGVMGLALAIVMQLLKIAIFILKYYLPGAIAHMMIKRYGKKQGDSTDAKPEGRVEMVMRVVHWLLTLGKLASSYYFAVKQVPRPPFPHFPPPPA
jgi:hypothetical protein